LPAPALGGPGNFPYLLWPGLAKRMGPERARDGRGSCCGNLGFLIGANPRAVGGAGAQSSQRFPALGKNDDGNPPAKLEPLGGSLVSDKQRFSDNLLRRPGGRTPAFLPDGRASGSDSSGRRAIGPSFLTRVVNVLGGEVFQVGPFRRPQESFCGRGGERGSPRACRARDNRTGKFPGISGGMAGPRAFCRLFTIQVASRCGPLPREFSNGLPKAAVGDRIAGPVFFRAGLAWPPGVHAGYGIGEICFRDNSSTSIEATLGLWTSNCCRRLGCPEKAFSGPSGARVGWIAASPLEPSEKG